MTSAITISIIVTIVLAATPILLAALGELVAEKSGVLNLGVEGMMLIGAVTGFIITLETGSLALGSLGAALAGTLAALLFGLLTLSLTANQVATGLALTIFGTGLSSLIGEAYVGKTVDNIPPLFGTAMAEHGSLRAIFGYPWLVYFSLFMVALIWYTLQKTRMGLILRAVGESDSSAHSIGYNVIGVRYAAVAFGGAMAGLAGSCYSMLLTPMWAEELTAGRGWIALALVVFSAWNPWRLLLGAYLFGGVMTLELHAKAAGIGFFAPEFLAALPYLATVFVLALIASHKSVGAQAPACLGKPFKATH